MFFFVVVLQCALLATDADPPRSDFRERHEVTKYLVYSLLVTLIGMLTTQTKTVINSPQPILSLTNVNLLNRILTVNKHTNCE